MCLHNAYSEEGVNMLGEVRVWGLKEFTVMFLRQF